MDSSAHPGWIGGLDVLSPNKPQHSAGYDTSDRVELPIQGVGCNGTGESNRAQALSRLQAQNKGKSLADQVI